VFLGYTFCVVFGIVYCGVCRVCYVVLRRVSCVVDLRFVAPCTDVCVVCVVCCNHR